MKILFCLTAIAAFASLSGCGSNASETGLTSEQRAQQMKTDSTLPAPAQARVDDQIEAKKQMDALRAQDAAKAAAK